MKFEMKPPVPGESGRADINSVTFSCAANASIVVESEEATALEALGWRRSTAVSGVGPYAPYAFGSSPSGAPVRVRGRARIAVNAPRWLTALSKWENGNLGRDLRVAVVSDSTFADDTQAGAAAQKTSVANALANQCRNRGLKCDSESFFGSFGGANVATIAGFDSRQAFTGATTLVNSQPVQGGVSITLGAAGTYALTPLKPFTKARVYWRNGAAGRQVSWACTGGASGNITSNATVEVGETVLDLGAVGTAGARTLTFTWVSGTFEIYGVVFYNDTGGQSNIQFLDMSCRGITSGSLNFVGATNDTGRVKSMTKYAPDLIIAQPGVVNDWNNSVTLDQSELNYQNFITLYAAIADVVFVTPPYSGGVLGQAAIQDQYVERLLKVADLNNIGVIDYRGHEESWAKASVASGWHPNADVHLGEGAKGNLARIIRNELGLV